MLVPSTAHFVLPLILQFLISLPSTSARQSQLQQRDIQTLSTDHLTYLAKAGPPNWEGTTEGHLGKLLVPRAGESADVQ